MVKVTVIEILELSLVYKVNILQRHDATSDRGQQKGRATRDVRNTYFEATSRVGSESDATTYVIRHGDSQS